MLTTSLRLELLWRASLWWVSWRPREYWLL